MDRFSWGNVLLADGEDFLTQNEGVRIYDGDQKTSFESGALVVTSWRIVWTNTFDANCCLVLPLSDVLSLDQVSASLSRSSKIVMYLKLASPGKPPGPINYSPNTYVRFSFTKGGQSEFFKVLERAVNDKAWEKKAVLPQAVPAKQAGKGMRAGIMGIERNIQRKQAETDRHISVAFEDLNKLIAKAKDMVALSRTISRKIRDRQGSISDDETVEFKAHLLSLGIPDPVTRETHGGGSYFRELAKQLSDALVEPLSEAGGTMTLTDVYCRINRARGMELLSPKDLLEGCQLFETLKLPLKLCQFESGVTVIQLRSHSEEEAVIETSQLVEEQGSMTSDDLARLIGLSVVLAKERLYLAEQKGHLCRDDCVEGLRFYPNLFLTRDTVSDSGDG